MKRFLILALATMFFTSCSNNDSNETVVPATTAEAKLTFDSKVGSADFALNKDFTVGSKTYNFKKLRYWVSNVSLVDSKGAEYKIPNAYYLIEEVGELDLTGTVNGNKNLYPARKRETIDFRDIPAGEYKSVKFSIGVDSKYNDNLSLGAGELTIANGMSNIAWMWHSSYIFSSLAGSVKEGTETKDFTTETGLNANYKTLTIDLATPVNFSNTKEIVLNVDVTKIFDGIDPIKNPTISAMSPTLMSTVADNYATKAIAFSTTVK
ncbi:MbnP family protein [Dyadobacter sp. CY312]|uniref:MbnP family protein n=1 Tax=Dyadobacter sp. CY312 TaxID=2907303 RepID=UPI001F2720D3|nr:MbnP family protein [Dyadobacter sp. CY312]MCE7041993.1 hypothetical protein [Dyadobacter sp. CY312]